MSQNQPQPPSSPKPRGNPQETQTPQVLKAQSIKGLRGTIRVLEGVVAKLEAEPAPGTAPSFLDQILNGWDAVLKKIRSFLPENLSALSNTALTGIIAGIAVILIWTTSVLLPGKPQPAVVANVPDSELAPTPTITPPPELAAPTEPEPIEVAPSPVEVIPSPEPKPELSPAPPVQLTPEQNLIASIQNQVSGISDRYADGLIQSIQANFEGSSLTVKVGDDWYNLKQSQQDKLAEKMLERSRELDFTHLEITDPQGKILARSPVVGNEMVILKRQV
ncbi:MAG: hypothetical protein KME05_02040 [Gloeocapsa sp. UFS-A4-WI-NPMV-4B04]|jgi:hypothetical protein|nr:hypothetical protein [Gloeocapsa sp. UFS-A4-WI-NPMV-4B04]